MKYKLLFEKLLEKRIFWKIYAFLFSIALISIEWSADYIKFVKWEGGDIYYIILDFIQDIPTAIVLFLFSFRKRWLPKNFWKIWAIFYTFWYVYDLKNAPQYTRELLEYSSLPTTFLYTNTLIIATVVFLLPAFICLYLYAFKEKR